MTFKRLLYGIRHRRRYFIESYFLFNDFIIVINYILLISYNLLKRMNCNHVTQHVKEILLAFRSMVQKIYYEFKFRSIVFK